VTIATSEVTTETMAIVKNINHRNSEVKILAIIIVK
jgi:hypothetical protein